ncbi:hypothetical protein BDZ45DRAFT_404668 [Acephala macrosclerotiorum]|nr:hypothetical protein BDZ45DRAFT_404668 [Acephala macrosclerotiorum]
MPTVIARHMRSELLPFYQRQTNQSLPSQQKQDLITKITDILKKDFDEPNQIVDISEVVILIFKQSGFPSRNQLQTSGVEQNTHDIVSTPKNTSSQPEDEARRNKRPANFTNSSKTRPKRQKKEAGESSGEGVSQSKGPYRCDEGKCQAKIICGKNYWRRHTAESHFPKTVYLCLHCLYPQTRKDHSEEHFKSHPDRQGAYVEDARELGDTYRYVSSDLPLRTLS